MTKIGVFFAILFIESRKISIQLDDEYYKNGDNAKIQKMYDNFR